MTTKQAYEQEINEFFQINDQVLEVLPSDIAAFSDNAVFEESFVRSKAVFAFRSKYSRGKVIVTLPVSISAFAEYDSGSQFSQNQGLKVLNQLSNFPYCFIKSPRVRSYISSRARISSTGFMMFAVDEINTVHDMRVPDVLFVEFHLVFCDHTSQAKDFKFYHNETSPGVDDPASSGAFVSAFQFDYSDRYLNSLNMIKSVVASAPEADNIAYADSAGPVGAVLVMAPNVLNNTEINEDSYEESLKAIKAQGLYKEVIVTAPDGQDSLTEAFFKESNMTTDEQVKANDPTKDAKQHFHIYWTAFHDFSFGGVSAMKTIKVSRKNKIAQQFIGSHKYPFVQYMGKYPARVEIGLDFYTGDIYKTGDSSVVSAIGQINNVLDYNTEFYPEISAYNVLKMQSVSSLLMGVESVVPNQTFISASSDNQGVETVSVNFIEADVEEFMEIGVKFEGRPSQYFDTTTDVETKSLLAYLTAIKTNPNVRTDIEKSPDRELHTQITKNIAAALDEIKTELFGVSRIEDVKEKYLNKPLSKVNPHSISSSGNNQSTAVTTPLSSALKGAESTPTKTGDRELDHINKIYESQPYGGLLLDPDYNDNTNTINMINTKNNYDWPSSGIFGSNYSDTATQNMIAILEHRQKLIAVTNANAGKSATDVKESSGTRYSVKNEDGEKILIDASETYARKGTTDTNIRKAYQALISLKTRGDTTAVSVLPDTDISSDYLKNRINSYAGNNIKDLEFAELLNPMVNPFFFLKFVPYFDASQILTVHHTIAGEINSAAETILTQRVEQTDGAILGKSGYFGIFSETGISVEEMYVVEESEDNTIVNAAGAALDMASYGADSGSYSGMSSKNSTAFDKIILEKAEKYKCDAGWLKAIIHQESGFNPKARSGAGALGLMQLVPKWHPGIGDYFDPAQNIDGGAKFFARLFAKYKGDTRSVLAAYNAGEARVADGKAFGFRETSDYIKKVTNYYNTLYKAGLNSNPASAEYKANTTDTNKGTANMADAANGTNKGIDLSKYKKVKVTEIDDGDTFSVEGWKEAIRTKHYETPETDHAMDEYKPLINGAGKPVSGFFTGQTYGRVSKDGLAAILRKEKQYVYVEKNPERDVYNRYLTTVYLPSDNSNLAEHMIKLGHATIWSQETAGGSAMMNTLTKYKEAAKKSKIGMWGPQYLDSQDAFTYKRLTEKLIEEVSKAKDEAATVAVMKKYAKIVGGLTYNIGTSIYDSKTHVKVGSKKEEDLSKAKPIADKGPVKPEFKNPYGTTNKDIHVKGATPGSLTSQWGIRKLDTDDAPRLHAGIDSAGAGTEIIAAADGIVTHTTMSGGGKVVVMNHGNGFYTKYLHLSRHIAANGAHVKAGTVIGEMGRTATKSGEIQIVQKTGKPSIPVHLHQETWVQPFGGTGSFNINPWKTTSLKLLSGMDPKDVHKNFALFIDKTHLESAHPTSLGKNVLGTPSANAPVWGGAGQGSSLDADRDYSKVMSGSSTTNNDGKVEGSYMGKKASVVASRQMPPQASVYNENGAVEIHAKNMVYMQKYGMNIAFPAIKIYVIIGNEAEDSKVLKEMMPTYYFEIEGIKNLALVCNNDDNPVDFLSFQIANASFIRTDNYSVAGKFLTRDLSKVATSAEVSFISDRIRLKPGTQLHIRAGYGNNPNDLRTIFNGSIMELGNEDGICLDVIAEGYGRELLMDPISPHKPTTPGNFLTNNSTPLIISTALGSREGIGHFGNTVNFWASVGSFITYGTPGLDQKAHDYSDPETKRLTTKYFDTEFRPGNYRQRIFTNIYAAEIENLHQNFNSTWWNFLGNLTSLTEQSGYYYIMHGQTPWAVMKEMEYRHPGTLAKPLFFQDRMTMFYGIKEQMYICRDLDSSFMAKVAVQDDTQVKSEYISKRPLRFDTVCNFHILSSELNIIQNNIKINAQYYSGVNVIYFEDKEDIVQKYENDDLKEFKMKIDDNLAQWEHRYKTVEMPGIHGKYSAFMYGTTELRRQAETMYGGNIVVVGNPCIKAGDFAYFSDNLRRFNGLIKVRECRHYFDESRGYVTEITPGLFVEASSFIYSALFLKLAFTARTALANASLSAQIIANDAADFQQYMDYFQNMQPFVKKDRGFGVSGTVDWFKMAYDETAGVPVLGVGLAGLSVYSMSRLITGASRMAMAKLASKGILNSKDIASIGKAVSDLKYVSLKSATSGKMIANAGKYVSSIRTASNLGKLGYAAAALGTAGGAASWWAATRTLKSITMIAGAALMTNPLGWVLRIAGTVALSFVFAKVQEAELTRQPLMVFPILYNGRPYTGGMTGYNYNTYLESLKANFNENWSQVTKAGAVMEATSEQSVVKAVGGMLADSNAFGLSDSYNDKQIERLQKMTYKGVKE